MANALHYQAFKSFLGPATVEGFKSSSAFRKDARGKLQKLPFEQFSELTKDVYDELVRRTQDIEYNAALSNDSLPSKRNQARQKLGTLSDKRFYDLVGDLFIEILIRYPGIDPLLKEDSGHDSGGNLYSLPQSNSSNSSFTYFDSNLTMSKEIPNLTSKHINGDKQSNYANKYDNELNHALKRNQSLERALSTQNSDPNLSLSRKNTFNETLSNPNAYEILKQDYHILRKEFEKLNISYKSLNAENEKLTVENENLKRSLAIYETNETQSIALQYSTLQIEHADLKEKYTTELKELTNKYQHIDQAQSVHREMFDAIAKNNEILEFKLRQVNQALEKSQKESLNSLKNGSSIGPVKDYGNSYLIHENLMRTLRSSVDKVLKSIRSKNSNDVLLSLKPLTETSRSIIDVVEQFEAEIQDSKQNCSIQISNNKEDFSSALANLMTLAKKEAASSNAQNFVRFEHEAKELLLAAEELQLLLQTNFCSLPYFSSKNNRYSSLSKMNNPYRDSFNSNQQTLNYNTNLSHISRIPQVHEDHDSSSSSLEDAILDPLRDYIEEKSDELIGCVDLIMEFVRNDDFSIHLSTEVENVHDKAVNIIKEFKQYRLIPRLMDSPVIVNSIKGVENANERFSSLLKDLEPIVGAKDLTIEEIEELDPTIKLLKTHLASTCLELAKSIKQLAQCLI
ncbi:hypothetical protein K502DRAFT_344685 [Neoconidiobolus thromboides FSU 785]|nr:hypothetical protein K502DRAFT_344685 [Neoconidiobolus thromboides FSU 785]